MNVVRLIAGGRIIEGQSYADDATLIANAVAAGFAQDDIETIVMSDEDFRAALIAQNTPDVWEVRKLLIVDRLNDAGLFDAVMTVLDAQPRLVRERWLAAQVINSDDAQVRALLAAGGADPDEILARE